MMISYLPLDLESEILYRLPATSLSQFRYICKRWYALFKDPIFVKKNLGRAAAQMILKKGGMVYSGIINLHDSFDPSFEFTGKLNSLKDSVNVEISEIFHCHGLLLCTTIDDRVVVWNPCTGQTKWIQPSNRNTDYGITLGYKYFLGYEDNNKSCGSYKILSFHIYFKEYKTLLEIEIYEFNSDSWRVLDDDTYDRYTWLQLSNGGVSLKGNTYWLDKCNMYNPVRFILMFDFTTERLGRMSLPFRGGYDPNNKSVVLSVLREEKLALLRLNSLEVKIWMTNTKIGEAKDLSWTDFLEVDFSKFMSTELTCLFSFLVDEENKMVVCCDRDIDYIDLEERTRILIFGENMHREVYKGITKGSSGSRPLLLSYAPSLVHM